MRVSGHAGARHRPYRLIVQGGKQIFGKLREQRLKIVDTSRVQNWCAINKGYWLICQVTTGWIRGSSKQSIFVSFRFFAMADKSDILLLGATGYTGALITRYLSAHPQRSQFTLALGARSPQKLNKLIEDLDLPKSVKTVQVDVTKPDEVEAAVKGARVVINTVGPYWLWGTPVVRYVAGTRNIRHTHCGVQSVARAFETVCIMSTLQARRHGYPKSSSSRSP